jgi:hypothetical protein
MPLQDLLEALALEPTEPALAIKVEYHSHRDAALLLDDPVELDKWYIQALCELSTERRLAGAPESYQCNAGTAHRIVNATEVLQKDFVRTTDFFRAELSQKCGGVCEIDGSLWAIDSESFKTKI